MTLTRVRLSDAWTTTREFETLAEAAREVRRFLLVNDYADTRYATRAAAEYRERGHVVASGYAFR